MFPFVFCCVAALIGLVATNSINSSVCVSEGIYGDIRGPYKYIGFNDTLNGNLYEYPRAQNTFYLYPHVLSDSYYWFISSALYSSFVFYFCYIGVTHDFEENYSFSIDDCQHWAFHNATAGEWQVYNLRVSFCQWNDICIENAKYLEYINTNYHFDHWNFSTNGAVYYNDIINKYIYPHRILNGTYAQYVLHGTLGDNMAHAVCHIGPKEYWYTFDLNDCVFWESYFALEWHTETNLSITNCSKSVLTVSPTTNPTLSPTINPTFQPTVNPTINPTLNPTMYSSSVPTVYPTIFTTDLVSHTISVDLQSAEISILKDANAILYIIGGVTGFILLLIVLICVLCVCVCRRGNVLGENEQNKARQIRVETDSKSMDAICKAEMKIFIEKEDFIHQALEMQTVSKEGNKSETEEYSKEIEGVVQTADIL